jgi:hypothetical protein
MSLAKALKTGNAKAIQGVIQGEDFDPNSVDPKTGESALHLLAKEDESGHLKELLDRFSSSSTKPANLELHDREGKVVSTDNRLLWHQP